jgi:hypothetical protein
MATKLLSIEEIMTGVTTASIELDKGSSQIQELRKAQASASERQAGIIDQAGKDAEAVARQQGLALLNAQKENVKAASAAGMTETSNALLDLLAVQRQANERLIARTAKIRELRGATPGEVGILSWVGRNFQAAFQEKAMEGEAQEVQAVSNALVTTNNALQQTFATNKGKAEVLTMETVAAQARIAAADAKVRAEQAVIEGLGYNIQGVSEAKNITLERLNLKYNARQAVSGIKAEQRAEEDQQMERQRFEWQKEMASLQKEALEAEKKGKEEAKVLDDATVANIELGRATLHLPRMTDGEKALILRQVRSGSLKGDVLLHHHLGLKSRQNGGKQVFGNSPSAAAEVVFNPELDVKVAEAQVETKNLLAEAYKAIPLQVKNSKDGAAVSRELDKQAALLVAQQFGDERGVDGAGYVGSESAFNVGDIGDLHTGYLDAAAVKNLPIVTKLLKPLAANKVAMKDPSAVLDLVRAAVKKGDLTSTQAADGLANVYRVANWMHQEQRNFAGYGLKLPNNGAQYIVKIGSKKLDLTKPEQVQRMLMTLNRYGGDVPVFAFEGP